VATEVTLSSVSFGTPLMNILGADDIQPGSTLGYQLAKEIFVSHPLGQKMAEAPITVAQSQKRKVSVQESPPEVLKAFLTQWQKDGADRFIKNTGTLARVYGASAVVMGCKGQPTDKPLDMTKIWEQPIFFNVLDPLNVAGSLVLSQIPGTYDFQRPIRVTTNGEVFHGSRFRVLMNEQPIYIEYEASAFGYTGRSVYRRAIYPLKCFIASMKADFTILQKLAFFIAKMKAPGSIIDNIMKGVAALKRLFIKEGDSGNVLSIDTEESIETLDMTNVDGAGSYARTNSLKNAATAADMPAVFLENETLTEGFGEGTEDAKNIARYIDTIREWLESLYEWFTNIIQYRAWNPEFYKTIQANYPEIYGSVAYEDAFSQWRAAFAAEWPSLLIEPESEQAKIAAVKFETLIATVQTLLPVLDPQNKAITIQWLADSVSENKILFPHGLALDIEVLRDYLVEEKDRSNEAQDAALEPDGVASKMGKFDSARPVLGNLRRAVAQLPSRMTGGRNASAPA
jgi:hypothetical protein